MKTSTTVCASRGSRLLAWVYDALIFSAVGVPTFLLVAFVLFWDQGEWGATELLVLCGLEISTFFMLNGYLLITRGQTIGKLWCNQQIVDRRGNVPGFSRVFGLRYGVPMLIASIPYLGGLLAVADALFIFSPDRRCLHDYLAGTFVIEGGEARTSVAIERASARCRRGRRKLAKAIVTRAPPARGPTVATGRGYGSSRDTRR